ncbi:hypothetical protein TL16_g09810 [Triparma laevis f. inornata]|uniref:Telomerase reverse transcriptase n=1 Tax=Triparma laevis f. inornata TaxID=1714386 RepID=A0A9W7B4W2_9STRA|nr:hypothetical protein TL16_g09810 [Triparma laevis f. inornata]
MKVGNSTLRMCYPNIVTLGGWLEKSLSDELREIQHQMELSTQAGGKVSSDVGSKILKNYSEEDDVNNMGQDCNDSGCVKSGGDKTLLGRKVTNPYAVSDRRSTEETYNNLLRKLKTSLRLLHTISSNPSHPIHTLLSTFLLSPKRDDKTGEQSSSASPPPSASLPPFKHFGKKLNPLHVLVDATVSHHVLEGHNKARLKSRKENNNNIFVRSTEGRDVMALGYTYSKETLTTTSNLQSSSLTPGTTNVHLNSSVAYFKSKGVMRLHEVLGDEWLTWVMRRCCCFVKCEGEEGGESRREGKKEEGGEGEDSRCYFQLSGEPVFGVIKRMETTKIQGKKAGGVKINETEKKRENIAVPRFRIFYSQSFVKEVGLPKNNLFNVLLKGGSLGMKRMLKIGDIKDDDIYKVLSNKKVPKVDSNIGNICSDVLKNYKKLNFCRIFEAACPIRKKGSSKKKGGKVTDEDLEGRDFKELIDMHTEHEAVIEYVTRVFSELFPARLFGTSSSIVMEGIRKFCTIRLKETVAECELMRGFKLKSVSWLYSINEGPVSRDCAISSFETFNTRYDVLEGDEVVERLGRGKMGAAELRIVPKEKSVRGITMLQKRRFVDGIDGKIKAKGEIVVSGVGAPSKKQKTTSAEQQQVDHVSSSAAAAATKPDATVNNKSFQTAKFKSTNNILQNSFQILKYEVERREDCFGSGIHISDIFSKVLSFKTKLIEQSSDGKTLPKLYWASSDIQSCFDNISQEHIFKLLQNMLDEDDYCISKYAVCHPYESRGKCNVKHVKSVSNDIVKFGDKAKKLAANYNESVFVDGVTVSVEHKDKLVELLKEHVFDNVVVARDGEGRERFLVQKEGIAQGSVLSTLLCNVYFGDVEGKLLKGVFKGEDGELNLLIRVVDDFLLVSTKKNVAVDFLKRMTEGIKELGVIVNKSKTTVSFQTEEAGRCVEGEDFPFCGLLFNTETCEARYEYERFKGSKAVDDLTVEVAKQPGVSMGIKSKAFVRPRCSEITLDSRLNGREQILDNVYQMFLLGGIKMNAYGRILEERRGGGKGVGGLMNLKLSSWTS